LKKYYSLLCDAPLKLDHKIYGSNNWYYAYGKISHSSVIKDAQLLAELCRGNTEKPYMIIDAGWEKNVHSAPWSELKEGAFYDMKALAAQMSEIGVRPGIWIRPLRDIHRLVFPEGAPQRCVRDGKYLDPSHPDTLNYIKNTLSMLRDWGYRFIKHDFSTFDTIGFWGFERKAEFAADGWHFYDRSKTTAEIFVGLNKAIYEATKGRAVVLGCNVIGHLAAGAVHLNRTGDDTSGKEWERTKVMGVNTLAFRLAQNETFYMCDADCVGILKNYIPWDKNSQWLHLLSYSNTPLFVSCTDKINPQQRAELSTAYKVFNEKDHQFTPVDIYENKTPEVWEIDGKTVKYNW
jgi:alpha-galactosidase